MKRGGLGRGLSALIPGAVEEGGLLEVPVAAVSPNPKQPRTIFSEDALEGLSSSIREVGVLQPIVVRKSGEGYVLIAVLLVVVVLSLAAYRFSEAMTAEYRASTRVGDVAQARANAVSGVYYAAAMLADPDTYQNKLGANPYDNDGLFRMIPVRPDDNPSRAGYASLKAIVSDGSVEKCEADVARLHAHGLWATMEHPS